MKCDKEEFYMLTLIFTILMFVVFGKLLIFAIKASWGITKFVVSVILLPLALIGLVIGGLITIALPLLLIIGLICFSRLAK